MSHERPTVLLVDDDEEGLASFANALDRRLDGQATVRCWRPTPEDIPLEDAFAKLADPSTALVVTDYDLTTSIGGFFGPSIIGWCQSRAIPVADFSRAHADARPKAPNLFELRVPADDANGSALAASLLRGFETIRSRVTEARLYTSSDRPLSATLAEVLHQPDIEIELAPYFRDLGAANSALFETIAQRPNPNASLTELKTQLLTYILGHVLWNAILRYPGVLLSADALCAYFATSSDDESELSGLFLDARYSGPFGDSGPWFWRHAVDSTIQAFSDSASNDVASFDEHNRTAAESALGRPLSGHPCERCSGTRGGFWCPFTSRPVCERPDCSTPESSWIPAGAYLARVERDYHDEWTPFLGL